MMKSVSLCIDTSIFTGHFIIYYKLDYVGHSFTKNLIKSDLNFKHIGDNHSQSKLLISESSKNYNF